MKDNDMHNGTNLFIRSIENGHHALVVLDGEDTVIKHIVKQLYKKLYLINLLSLSKTKEMSKLHYVKMGKKNIMIHNEFKLIILWKNKSYLERFFKDNMDNKVLFDYTRILA